VILSSPTLSPEKSLHLQALCSTNKPLRPTHYTRPPRSSICGFLNQFAFLRREPEGVVHDVVHHALTRRLDRHTRRRGSPHQINFSRRQTVGSIDQIRQSLAAGLRRTAERGRRSLTASTKVSSFRLVKFSNRWPGFSISNSVLSQPRSSLAFPHRSLVRVTSRAALVSPSPRISAVG
jgi:hypothetical protein